MANVAVRIDVLDADWGDAQPEEIQKVCGSVASCFDSAVAEKAVEPILVEPSTLNPPGPRTLFERTQTGQVRIMLSIRGRLWAKCAYQFAHEFCHVLANIPAVVPASVSPSNWIEEALCEASSLFALRAMGRSWRQAPPFRNWADYAPALLAYADDFLSDPKHQLPADERFTDWLPRLLPALERDCYRREDNAAVAIRVLPVFEEEPDVWRAVRYLNLWSAADLPFAEYFSAWRSVAPSHCHPLVNRLERRFLSE